MQIVFMGIRIKNLSLYYIFKEICKYKKMPGCFFNETYLGIFLLHTGTFPQAKRKILGKFVIFALRNEFTLVL